MTIMVKKQTKNATSQIPKADLEKEWSSTKHVGRSTRSSEGAVTGETPIRV